MLTTYLIPKLNGITYASVYVVDPDIVTLQKHLAYTNLQYRSCIVVKLY